MNDYIIYKVWENGGNYHNMVRFCGEEPKCLICEGTGEYEDEFGLHGCQLCNSRLFAFIDHSGKRVYADDGDRIERTTEGLKLVQSEFFANGNKKN